MTTNYFIYFLGVYVMSSIQLTKDTPLCQIASIIKNDWKKVYFGAVPYLQAMGRLNTIDDKYGFDDAKSIVIYFLSNASSWRGEVAKEVKAHLKSIVK